MSTMCISVKLGTFGYNHFPESPWPPPVQLRTAYYASTPVKVVENPHESHVAHSSSIMKHNYSCALCHCLLCCCAIFKPQPGIANAYLSGDWQIPYSPLPFFLPINQSSSNDRGSSCSRWGVGVDTMGKTRFSCAHVSLVRCWWCGPCRCREWQ